MTGRAAPLPLAAWMLSASPISPDEIRRVFSEGTQVYLTMQQARAALGEGSRMGLIQVLSLWLI